MSKKLDFSKTEIRVGSYVISDPDDIEQLIHNAQNALEMRRKYEEAADDAKRIEELVNKFINNYGELRIYADNHEIILDENSSPFFAPY